MGGFYPPNPLLGQKMQTAAEGVIVDAVFIAHLNILATEATVAADASVHAAFTTSTNPTMVTTGIVNPVYPKNITAKAAGVAGDVKAVKVKITGTNFADEVITEELPAFTVDTLGSVVGSKAFKTVTKIEVPAMDGAGVTVAIGHGEKLGIPFKLTHNTVLATYHDNTKEATAPTVAVSATALESNTIDLDTALNGKVVDVYLMV